MLSLHAKHEVVVTGESPVVVTDAETKPNLTQASLHELDDDAAHAVQEVELPKYPASKHSEKHGLVLLTYPEHALQVALSK